MSRRDDHALGIQFDPILLAIMECDARAQGRGAERFGIAEAAARERRAGGCKRRRRRRSRRLTYLHVNDAPTPLLYARSRRHHIHDHESGHVTAQRRSNQPFRIGHEERTRWITFPKLLPRTLRGVGTGFGKDHAQAKLERDGNSDKRHPTPGGQFAPLSPHLYSQFNAVAPMQHVMAAAST